MPAPLIVAGVLGALRLGAMVAPRVIQLARVAGPAIVRNAPKVVAKGKELVGRAAVTGSRLIKEYGPAVQGGLSKLAKGGARAMSGIGKFVKGAVKLGTIGALSSLLGKDKNPDADAIGGSTEIQQDNNGKLVPVRPKEVVSVNSGSAGSQEISSASATAPQRINNRTKREGSDQYVTYSALYKILEDFAEDTKAFITSTFESLLPPLSALEKSTTTLSENIKALVGLLESNRKQQAAAIKEQAAERPYRQQTDKELLDEIRGKDTAKKGVGGILKGGVAALALLLATTKAKKEEDSADGARAQPSSAPAGGADVEPSSPQPAITTSSGATVEPISSDSQTTPPPTPANATRQPSEISTAIPASMGAAMGAGKEKIESLITPVVKTAVTLMEKTKEAKKKAAPLAPIVLPSSASGTQSSPAFPSTNQRANILSVATLGPKEPLSQVNFT